MASTVRNSVRSTWRWFFDDARAATLVLAMILSVDALLALIHVVVMVGWNAPDIWRIDMDGSYGEAYQYVKYLWVSILLVVYARQNRDWPILGWLPLFIYFIVDDALLIHEQAGYWYSSQDWAFGLGPISAQNVGELATSALVGLALLVPLVVGYVRGTPRTKWIYRVVVALMVALLFFAVVVDAVHGLFMNIRLIDRGLGFLEDLGEMVVLSVIVGVFFRINVGGGQKGFSQDAAGPAASEPTTQTRRALRR
ncbi:hypothetical protein [Microbacterium pygmaeum]|uniref:Uncharacterized protein n=1 Tax=Microbacterium pygmaeum TaxID=370764 RepID=A0A1G7ZS79_9MICO|nr:hypothetical protein [Microbacterium pygmaeum]SDH11477.1 hypothetical protein SAMN04489810_2148 [Microbacterium pygmaeum]